MTDTDILRTHEERLTVLEQDRIQHLEALLRAAMKEIDRNAERIRTMEQLAPELRALVHYHVKEQLKDVAAEAIGKVVQVISKSWTEEFLPALRDQVRSDIATAVASLGNGGTQTV